MGAPFLDTPANYSIANGSTLWHSGHIAKLTSSSSKFPSSLSVLFQTTQTLFRGKLQCGQFGYTVHSPSSMTSGSTGPSSSSLPVSSSMDSLPAGVGVSLCALYSASSDLLRCLRQITYNTIRTSKTTTVDSKLIFHLPFFTR